MSLLVASATIARAHRRAEYRRKLRGAVIVHTRPRNSDVFHVTGIERVYRMADRNLHDVQMDTIARMRGLKADGSTTEYRVVTLVIGSVSLAARVIDDTDI